jgi:hypothetical protein
MTPLIVIPAVKNAHVTREALDSVIGLGVDIIVCANGADEDVIQLFHEFKEKFRNISIWHEPTNIGVNPIWNKFVQHFLASSYTHIGILSSDVIMQSQFLEVLQNRDIPNEMPIPIEVDKVTVYEKLDPAGQVGQVVTEGTNGIFIWLSKEQARIAFPIPDGIKIWFGDNWIHEKLRIAGHKTVILGNFQAFHHGSVTLKEMSTSSEDIERDKINWQTIRKQLYE